MYDELWKSDGMDRLIEIEKLKLNEFDEICVFHKSCSKCPLAILHRDKLGYQRLLCVDVATSKAVLTALESGGRFLRKGEKL